MSAFDRVIHRGAAIATALAIMLVFCGCSSVRPASVRAEWEHVSHPFAGWPFGPPWEEDTLDHVNVIGRWQSGPLYTELGLGYLLADGGFYGPNLTGTCRVGVELWQRH